MATLTTDTIVGGDRTVIVRGRIDGATGDLANAVLFDASAHATSLGLPGDVIRDWRIVCVESMLVGFSAQLEYGGDDVLAMPLPEGFNDGYKPGNQENGVIGGYAGLPLSPSLTGSFNGDVGISTTGFTAAAGQGGLVIVWIKIKDL